jgi:hypothetical protein
VGVAWLNVRFVPKATESLRIGEMTQWADSVENGGCCDAEGSMIQSV